MIKRLIIAAFAIVAAHAAQAQSAEPPTSPSLPGCWFTGSPSTLAPNTGGYLLCDATHHLAVSGTFNANTTAVASATPPTYSPGTQPLSEDLNGNLRISGTINASSSAQATTTAPTYVNNTSNAFSQDLSGNLRTISQSVQSGAWDIRNITGTIPLPTGAALDATVAALTKAQGSTSSGQLGPLVQGAATTSAPTDTTGNTYPLSLTTAGALRTDNSAVTQPVSGTFWQATQPVSGAFFQATQPVSGTVTANAGTGTFAVSGAFFQATQPVSGTVTANAGTGTFAVSGTVTANAGTNLNTSALELDTTGAKLNLAQASTTAAQTGPLTQGAVTTAAPSYTTAQTDPLSLTTAGALRVDGSSVTSPVSIASLPLPSGAATSANQTNASQKTQIVDGTGNVIASTSNNLNVQCANCSGSGASAADQASFTAGLSTFAPSGCFFQTTPTTAPLTTGQQGMAQCTAQRAWFTNLRNASGTEVGTAVAPLRVDPTGTTTQPVSGTVTANAGTGTFAVSGSVTANAGTNLNTSALALDTSVAKLNLAQGSTTSGQTGALIQGAVTTASPTYTTAQSNPLSLTTAGALRTDSSATTQPVSGTFFQGTQPVSGTVTANAGTGTFTVSGSVTANAGTNLNTSALALDTTVAKLNLAQASTTSGQTGTLAQCAVTTTAPTYTTAQTDPCSLTTAGALRTDASGTTQPVSGTVTANAGTGTFAVSGSVTANAGTNLNTSALALETGGNLAALANAVGSTGSAVPSKAVYDGSNIGGNLVGNIRCQSSIPYDAATSGSTQLVALSAGKVIYICGFHIIASGTVNVKLLYGTGTACATGATNITPAYQLTAQAGLTDDPGIYQGLNAIASNELCINASGAVAVQAIVYFTQF